MKSKFRNKYNKLSLFLIIIILTLLLSEMPGFHPHLILGIKYDWWQDVVFHGGYYFVATFILYLFFYKGQKIIVFSAAIFLFSIVLEGFQAFTPDRSISIIDLASNLIGICFGTAMGYLISSKNADNDLKQEPGAN